MKVLGSAKARGNWPFATKPTLLDLRPLSAKRSARTQCLDSLGRD
jgi:hypothetical protein